MKTRLSALYPFVLGIALLYVSQLLWPQTRINPDQLKAPRVAVMTCTKAPTVTVDPVTAVPRISDCAGLYYVDVITAAGTELKILGTVQPAPVNAADWALVP